MRTLVAKCPSTMPRARAESSNDGPRDPPRQQNAGDEREHGSGQ